jgi:hypothetical protein
VSGVFGILATPSERNRSLLMHVSWDLLPDFTLADPAGRSNLDTTLGRREKLAAACTVAS